MEILSLLIGSGGFLGVLLMVFRMGKLVKACEHTAEKVSELGDEIKEVKEEIKEMRKDINDIKVQIGKLETRVDERTLRVLHTQVQPERPRSLPHDGEVI